MALFTNPTTTPAQQAAQQIRQQAKSTFMLMNQAGVKGWNLLWKNTQATPADILAALGTDTQAIFTLANLNIATLNTAGSIGGVAALTIPGIPAGYTVTINADGSATVTGNRT
jgi:hypothetical protein